MATIVRNCLIIAACYLVRLAALPLAPFSTGIWRLYQAQLFPLSFWRTLSLGYHRRFAKWERQLVWRRVKGSPVPLLSWARIKGAEYLAQARSSQRGILLITFHSPFFRVFQYLINQFDESYQPYLARYYVPSVQTIISKKPHEHQFRIFNGRLLDLTQAGIRRMAKLLIQGETVVLTPDSWDAMRPKVDLFGRKMALTMGFIRLAEMTDALIIPAIATGRLRFRPWLIHFGAPIDPRQGLTQIRLLAALEEVLSAYPEIWSRWHMVLKAPKAEEHDAK